MLPINHNLMSSGQASWGMGMKSRNVQFDVRPVAEVFKGVMLPENVKFYPVLNRITEPRNVQFKFRVMFKVPWSL